MKTNNLARNYGSFNLSTSFRNVAGSAGSFAAALIASKAVSVYRYADLLVEVVTRRYEAQKPVLLSTNKPFSHWAEVFPHQPSSSRSSTGSSIAPRSSTSRPKATASKKPRSSPPREPSAARPRKTDARAGLTRRLRSRVLHR